MEIILIATVKRLLMYNVFTTKNESGLLLWFSRVVIDQL